MVHGVHGDMMAPAQQHVGTGLEQEIEIAIIPRQPTVDFNVLDTAQRKKYATYIPALVIFLHTILLPSYSQ